MKTKIIFELEFVLKTSPKVLNTMLFTQAGLTEWFCDNLIVKDDIYAFDWEGYIEKARLISLKPNHSIQFKWLEEDYDDIESHFGFSYHIDPVTNAVILKIHGTSDDDELEESKALWEQHILDLKRVIGA